MQRPLLALLVACSITSCGGSSAPSAPASSLIDQTTAGAQRCVDQGDEHKLFVVEWDATDGSTFQARAERDIVFVAFEDCQMRVIDGCSDGSLAGRYGTYRKPVFTSGATESFVIETQDELATKLPLGVVTLGGELAKRRALELTYHVSGTAVATRDEVHRADLADNPRCAEATHVVVAYNLGAFELGTRDDLTASAGASTSFGEAEGAHAESQEKLRRAGELGDCKRIDNHGCRIPIRLTLRPIRPGTAEAPPVASAGAPTPAGAVEAPLAAAQAMMNMVGYEQSAQQKYMAHDGAGCLADLEKADAQDPQGKLRRLDLRARCEMRAGQCDAGKKHFREARRAFYRDNNPTGLASEATIDHEVSQLAAAECATAAGGGKSVQNNALGLVQQILIASGKGDAGRCVELGKQLDASVSATGSQDPAAHMAWAGLKQAAECAAAGGKCADAKRLYVQFTKRMSPGADDAFAASAFEQNVKGCKP